MPETPEAYQLRRLRQTVEDETRKLRRILFTSLRIPFDTEGELERIARNLEEAVRDT